MLNAKRKPRDRPVNRPPAKRQKKSNAAVPDATPVTQPSRQNLALGDWLVVYAYIDAHPDESQARVVEYFRTRPEGALIFTQATLSRKLRERARMEARANDNPGALSSKRPRIVTRPDVERALVLWVRDVEQRGEIASGPMLQEKRKVFEDMFQVPEAERLSGDSWVQSFRRAYQLRRRGAGSADLEEQPSCQQLVANGAQSNVDETAFDPCSLPDLELAVEDELMEGIAHMRSPNYGPPLTLDELSCPPDEDEIRELELFSTDGKSEQEIVDAVHHEMAAARGEIIEIDSPDEEDEEDNPEPSITRSEAMGLCKRLESAVLEHGRAEHFELLKQLRRFRGYLRKQELPHNKQAKLDEYFVHC